MNKQELNEYIWNENIITKARAVSDIVHLGVDNEQYSKINEQLHKLQDAKNTMEKYVFEHSSFAMLHIQMGLSFIMSIVYALFLVISIEVCFLSDEYRIYGGIGCAVIGIILISNLFWYLRVLLKKKFYLRYEIYYQIMCFKNIELVTDLAVFSKQSENIVINDMQKAIKYKLIPQGHLIMNKEIIIVSDKTYERYKKNKTVYDRYFERLLDSRKTMTERTSDMDMIMKKRECYIEKLHESKKVIKNKNIVHILNRMEGLIQMMFYELDICPQKLEKCKEFLGYYIPTIEKLLENYINLDSKKSGAVKVKKEIEHTLELINGIF